MWTSRRQSGKDAGAAAAVWSSGGIGEGPVSRIFEHIFRVYETSLPTNKHDSHANRIAAEMAQNIRMYAFEGPAGSEKKLAEPGILAVCRADAEASDTASRPSTRMG